MRVVVSVCPPFTWADNRELGHFYTWIVLTYLAHGREGGRCGERDLWWVMWRFEWCVVIKRWTGPVVSGVGVVNWVVDVV